jgi:hypothetical protein
LPQKVLDVSLIHANNKKNSKFSQFLFGLWPTGSRTVATRIVGIEHLSRCGVCDDHERQFFLDKAKVKRFIFKQLFLNKIKDTC